MATTGRNDWRSRPPHSYSSSYDPYYGSPDAHAPPSYPGPYYGTPRGSSGVPPSGPPHSSHPHHSPMVSRSDSDFFYHDVPHSRSMSPTHGAPPHHPHAAHPFDRQHPPMASTPYRGGRPAPTHRSQIIHRGTPPYSARGASNAGTPRSHHRAYGESRSNTFFPDSPFAGRSRSLPPGPPRTSRLVMPLHRQHLPPIPRNAGPAPWEPPSPETQKKPSDLDREDDEPEFDRTHSREDNEGDEEDKGGDPLALLAKVSSDMETKPGQKSKKSDSGSHVSSVPPTSPLRRTTRTSPVITPTTDNTSSNKRKSEVHVHPSFPEVPPPPRSVPPPVKGPKAVTPMPPYYPPYGEDPRGAPPPYHYNAPPPGRNAAYQPYPPPGRGGPVPPGWPRGVDPEFGPPQSHPAVVERHSFDSHESGISHDSSSLQPARRYFGPPPPGHGSFGPPSQEWPSSPPPPGPSMSRPPPPGQPYSSRFMYGGVPPPPQPPRPGDPYHAAPYTYVQQPHIEEKTVLRRKFSWKHYPEVSTILLGSGHIFLSIRISQPLLFLLLVGTVFDRQSR